MANSIVAALDALREETAGLRTAQEAGNELLLEALEALRPAELEYIEPESGEVLPEEKPKGEGKQA